MPDWSPTRRRHGLRAAPMPLDRHGARPRALVFEDVGRHGPKAGEVASDLARRWAAYAEAGPRAEHDPRLLVRALLHAATADLRRLALSGGDRADVAVLTAARIFHLLVILLRTGTYRPGAPDEVLAWILLLHLLPAGWADTLDNAARERCRPSQAPVGKDQG